MGGASRTTGVTVVVYVRFLIFKTSRIESVSNIAMETEEVCSNERELIKRFRKKKTSSDFTLIWQYCSCKYYENQSHSDDPFRGKMEPHQAMKGESKRRWGCVQCNKR